jgi:molecular chaperone HtpG
MIERMNNQIDEDRFADWTSLLFDQAILAEGGQLEDPAGFVSRLNELMFDMAS